MAGRHGTYGRLIGGEPWAGRPFARAEAAAEDVGGEQNVAREDRGEGREQPGEGRVRAWLTPWLLQRCWRAWSTSPPVQAMLDWVAAGRPLYLYLHPELTNYR